MKVAFINAVYGFGSTGLIVRDLEQMVLLQGYESFVAYQSAATLPPSGMQVGNWVDWKWHALMTRIAGKQGYSSKRATQKLIKRLRTEKPNVVHLHNLHSNYIHIPSLLSYLAEAGIPTVLTLHDCWFFTGKCFHFAHCGCEKWRTECENCPQNKQSVKSWFVDSTKAVFQYRKTLFERIPNLVAVGCSDWITNLAKESPILRNARFERIYNGIDTYIFVPEGRENARIKLTLNNRFVSMGMANKWLLQENKAMLDYFLENMLDEEILLLVGCSEAQCEVLKAEPKIRPIPFVKDRKSLANLYRCADVFINLTFEDTLPTVNMEAICCGTPVITYRSCGSPELVQEGITGFVVEQYDYTGVRKAVRQIASGELSREKCAQIGKRNFDKDVQYLQYLQLYKELTALRRVGWDTR